jgi:hypothetical protein
MPSPPAENLPSVSDVVAEFRRAFDEHPRPEAGAVMELLRDLHDNNLTQWRREDSVRSHDASDAVIAAAKRDIDALNLRRHHLVEAIDAAVDAAIAQTPSATPATESPASVFDRLSILVIRISFTERAASSPRHDRDAFAARLPVLRRQLELLQEALEALLEELRDGRKRFVPHQSLKLYES